MVTTEALIVLFVVVLLLVVLLHRRWEKSRTKGRSLTDGHRAILRKYVLFYDRLDAPGRERFEHAVTEFLFKKNWRAVGMDLEEEKKVMIAASAAQLLHGLPSVGLEHFEQIVIFPDAYRAGSGDRWHQGEVQPKSGTIVISWKHFLQGYSLNHDGRNVALHEMAHALWFEDMIPNAEQGFFHREDRKKWNNVARGVILDIREGRETFFRDYAGTDEQEFFAVAVEYFFERPLLFKAAHPDLYALLCALLRQDPLDLLKTGGKGS